MSSRVGSAAMTNTLSRLVILGTGWSSFSLLKNVKTKFYHVIVVSPRNHFLFTPLLCSTTVGTLEFRFVSQGQATMKLFDLPSTEDDAIKLFQDYGVLPRQRFCPNHHPDHPVPGLEPKCLNLGEVDKFRSIIEPVRDFIFQQASDYHMAEATSIDFANQQVECRSALSANGPIVSRIAYDKLVIGVGALPSTFNVPGVEQHSYFLKEISDARRIRNHLIENFELSLEKISEEERRRLKHVVIVGGGPTGIEFGAELYDFCKSDLARLYKDFGPPPRVTLIESHKILGSFDKRLQSYAEGKLRSRENFSIVKATVVEVKSDCVVLNDGRVLPCGLVVWSTGLSARPLIRSLEVTKNKHGQIITDANLNIVADRSANSYAIGDCASIMDSPLPATAQVAERQGRYLADRLNRLASEKPAIPFYFKSMGMLAYIGGNEALSDLRDLKLRGFTSWILWRSAYLTRLGSWRLRLQVPLDWLKTMIFGRDTSKF